MKLLLILKRMIILFTKENQVYKKITDINKNSGNGNRK